MPYLAADLLVETFQHWGIDTLFGARSTGNIEILQALAPPPSGMRMIWTRSAESAASLACGYAKTTGRMGVCLAFSEPAALRMLPGLYDAILDAQPVVVLTSQALEHNPIMLPSFDRPYMDAAVLNIRLTRPDDITQTVDLACRAALAYSGVAHIHIAPNVLGQPVEPASPSPEALSYHNIPQRVRPSPEGDLRQAVEILNTGQKVAILAGRGALNATSEIGVLAEKLGAPVVKTLMGKGVIPDNDPHSMGCMGPCGTLPAQRALAECDTLLMVGATFPYRSSMSHPIQARAIQIDADLARIGLNYAVEVGIIGDSQRSLRDLLPQLQPNTDRSFLTACQEEMKQWQAQIEQQVAQLNGSLKPQQVAWEVGSALPEDAILASDPQQVRGWWARYVQVKPGQLHLTSGRLALPGTALAYAMAGQAAYPGRLCVALSSEDGFSAMQAEFATCASENLPVKVILFTDGTGKTEMMDYSALAKGSGADAYQIAQPVECQAVIKAALASPGPALVEARVDPAEVLPAPESLF